MINVVKVRLMGLPGEAEMLADALVKAGVVLERSRSYPNRGQSSYVRVYLEVEIPAGHKGTAERRLLDDSR